MFLGITNFLVLFQITYKRHGAHQSKENTMFRFTKGSWTEERKRSGRIGLNLPQPRAPRHANRCSPAAEKAPKKPAETASHYSLKTQPSARTGLPSLLRSSSPSRHRNLCKILIGRVKQSRASAILYPPRDRLLQYSLYRARHKLLANLIKTRRGLRDEWAAFRFLNH